MADSKICTECGEEKPLEDFYRDYRREGARRSKCKACYAEQSTGWRAKNPEHYREIYQAYNKKRYAQKREEENRRVREWQRRNPEKKRQYGHRDYQKHTEGYKARARIRKARKRNSLIRLTAKEQREILAHGCFFCGAEEGLQIAHDLPLAEEGPTTRANVFCLCGACNNAMGTNPLSNVIRQMEMRDA